MFYDSYVPQPPLSHLIHNIWYVEGHAPTLRKQRHLPTGMAEIVMNLSPGPGNPIFAGPFSEHFNFELNGPTCVLGVQFKSGGAFPLLKLPTSELHNLHVPLQDVWGTKGPELRERLMPASTPMARFKIMEQFLLSQICNPMGLDPAVSFALQRFQATPDECTVSRIVETTGLTHRRFGQLFSRQVGMKPKLFLRLQRFQRAIWKAEGQQDVDWANLAIDCGYFDQAHLIHNFQEFAGLTPESWLALRHESPFLINLDS